MSYSGSCHCGAIAFSVAGDIPTSALSCNCSNCRRKGLLLSVVPPSTFELVSGGAAMKSYFFNAHRISHRVCGTCGCEPFAFGKDEGGSEVVAVNLRCVPSVDIDGLSLQKVDGASR